MHRVPFAAIFMLAALASGARGDDAAVSGARDYEVYCASCHGVEAKGDGPVAEFLALTPADLTQLSRNNGGVFLRERVEAAIDGRAQVRTHGPRDMPVWGDWFKVETESGLKDKVREAQVTARIQALAAYIETLQAK